MLRIWLTLGMLSIGCWASAQELAPEVPTPPNPAPPPPAIGLLRPLTIGIVTEPAPAKRLARLEAGGDLAADDERIGQAARLLERTTAVFIEDAPRISELTARVCEEIRAGGRPSSPFEILEGARFWRLPPGNWGSVPRRFEHFAADYRRLRIAGARDHAQALSALGAVGPVAPPAGPTR